MGWRFYRRVKVLPGVTLNVSKKGTSVSVGVRGAHVTVGPNGTRRTVGIPGTGISYSTTKPASPLTFTVWKVLATIAILLGLIGLLLHA
jgi:hypothetical protein